MRVYVIIMALVAIFFVSKGSNNPSGYDFGKEISSQELNNHLKVIASDELKGRNTGSRGQQLAAEYITNHFSDLGLSKIVESPIGKSYFQNIDLQKARLNDVQISFDGFKCNFMKDFYCYSIYRDSTINLETEFIGYGIESEKINEQSNKNLEGKVAIALWGEPQINDSTYFLSGNETPSIWSGRYGWLKKARLAKKMGAVEIIFLLPDSLFADYLVEKRNYIFSEKLLLPENRDLNMSSRYGGIFMPESLFEKISTSKNKDLNNYKNKILSNEILTIKTAKHVKIKTQYELEDVIASNVLGFLKGSDSASGTVVLTAHYDHIGYDEEGIFNGADDDGSGTVTLMEIAESFAIARDNGIVPKKNVLFMAVTGEEKGLLGSKYFTDYDPVIPLKDIVCNVNIDMVGRIDDDHKNNENYIYTIGSGRLSSQLKKLHERVNKKTEKLDLDFEYDRLDDPNNFYKRSDHYNFAKNDIPVIFYFNGSHDDYHQRSDTVEKIRFDVMEKRARLIYYTSWEIANIDGRFELDQKQLEEETE